MEGNEGFGVTLGNDKAVIGNGKNVDVMLDVDAIQITRLSNQLILGVLM